MAVIVKPIDVDAPGSFRERMRILRVLKQIRAEEVGYVEGQLLLDELLCERAETDDGSDLEAALDGLSAAEANKLVLSLLESRVPTESAGE